MGVVAQPSRWQEQPPQRAGSTAQAHSLGTRMQARARGASVARNARGPGGPRKRGGRPWHSQLTAGNCLVMPAGWWQGLPACGAAFGRFGPGQHVPGDAVAGGPGPTGRPWWYGRGCCSGTSRRSRWRDTAPSAASSTPAGCTITRYKCTVRAGVQMRLHRHVRIGHARSCISVAECLGLVRRRCPLTP